MKNNNDTKVCQNCFEEPTQPNSSLCKYCDDFTIDYDNDNLDDLIESIEL